MFRSRNDLDLYERNGASWWEDGHRAFASLRNVTDYHRQLLLEWLDRPVDGLRVVDLGCGGGFMTVPLARAGAHVIGVDLSPASLRAARDEAPASAAHFIAGDLGRPPLADGCADLVILSDVVEHVDDPAGAIAAGARLVRGGGAVFVSTINRTLRARLLAITVAEGLRLVPPGTHDPKMFVRPAELERFAGAAGLRCVHLQGEAPDLPATVRDWTVHLRRSRSLAVGYAALLQKETA